MKLRKNKKLLITLAVFIALIGVCIAAYFAYGSTMINPDSEKSVINFLSTDKENPIDILVTKKYGDTFLVLYTDPVVTAKNKDISCFSSFKKNKYYKNRYNPMSLDSGNATDVQVYGIELEGVSLQGDTRSYAITNYASQETKCSVFEVDPKLLRYTNRLDVIDVPKNEPYIIVKEYKTQSKDSVLIAYDGIVELEHLNAEY